MSKYLIAFVIFNLGICKLSSSARINCDYGGNGNYAGILGYIYQCEVDHDPEILTKESSTITEITGFHTYSRTDQSVLGIRAAHKTIKYFPQGMEKIFANLNLIDFYGVGLLEVHQDDLKAFPDLVVLYLGHNEIESLESGLFDYNPKLQVIAFPYNGIKEIHPDIFDNLNVLIRFWFKGNNCIDNEYNSRYDITNALTRVYNNCAPKVEKTSSESELDDNLSEHNYGLYDYSENAGDSIKTVEMSKDDSGRHCGNLMLIGLMTAIFRLI
ncbi:uncharacterized protein [Chironomus tepperi]|uniref:uncharacterized protein n=1 Tax=Chironomus tepperi TaxID=113505 RepID=UPI00391FA420